MYRSWYLNVAKNLHNTILFFNDNNNEYRRNFTIVKKLLEDFCWLDKVGEFIKSLLKKHFYNKFFYP